MISKTDNPKNDGRKDADKRLKTGKVSNANDKYQVTMNFGQKEKVDELTEQEFKEWAEAEMKNRAQEGQRLREQMEAKELKLKKEAQAKEKAQEEQRLEKEAPAKRKAELDSKSQKEVEGHIKLEKKLILKEGPEVKKSAEVVLKERAEAQAKKRAEDEKIQRDNAEVQRIIQGEESRKAEAEVQKISQEEQGRKAESEAKGIIQEEHRLNPDSVVNRVTQGKDRREKMEKDIKLRDEEWRKFKEEVDTQGHPKSENQPEYSGASNIGLEGIPEPKNENRKRKILIIVSIAALAILVLWIFSVFTTGTEEQTPILLDNDANTEDVSHTPKLESAATNQQESASDREIGDPFEGGMIFTIVPSGRTGKVAYSKDLGPMPWQEAMNIHEQLGDGWRLPTMNELGTMRRNIGQGANNIGQFSDELYWSATPYDANQARLLRFADGNTSFHYNNSLSTRTFLVRAVRDFSR